MKQHQVKAGAGRIPSWLNIPIGIGIILIAALIFCAVFAPFITKYSPLKVDIRNITASPSYDHPFGTDDLGRDLFSRVIYGSRISLLVGVIATLISLVIAIVIGIISGYYGGWIDSFLMRFTDIVLAFPTALFAIAVMAVFENPSIDKVFIVLGLIGWPGAARLVRGQVLSLRELEYIQAARAIGMNEQRILWRHILPNSLAPILVMATLMIPGNILTEAWLSFLGLGAQPPDPSWGSMITEGQAYLETKPWLCIFPGIAIFATVLGFNLFGDGLRDYLDPRLKRSRT